MRHVCKQGEIERSDILDAVFVGNRSCIFCSSRIDPTELGGAPLALPFSARSMLKSSEIESTQSRRPGLQLALYPRAFGHCRPPSGSGHADRRSAPPGRDEPAWSMSHQCARSYSAIHAHRGLPPPPPAPAFEGAEIFLRRSVPHPDHRNAFASIPSPSSHLPRRHRYRGPGPMNPDFDEVAKESRSHRVCGLRQSSEIIAENVSSPGIINRRWRQSTAIWLRPARQIISKWRTFSYLLRKANRG